MEEEQYRAFVRTADGVLTRVTLFGGDVDQVTGINEAGTVIGASAIDFHGGRGRAFVWRDGITSALPVPEDCQSSFASDINERGDIVGSIDPIGAEGYATLWEGGLPLDLNHAIPDDSGWTLR